MKLCRVSIFTVLGLAVILVACVGPGVPTAPTTVVVATQIPKTPSVSHGEDFGGYIGLVDALREAGATVEPAGKVEQPFFSVKGQLIKVNGGDVQVFEYPDEAAAEAEAALIFRDGSPVANVISWVATPHFYHKGNLIVLYVGDDDAVTSVLEEVLGKQFAPYGQAHGGPITDYDSLVDNLLATGGLVESTEEEIVQPFFSAKGRLVRFNGNDLQVFEYPVEEQAEAAAALVSPDGSSIGTTMVTWIGMPHFYKAGRLIVLYVGEDQATVSMLEGVFGTQFAGGALALDPALRCPAPSKDTSLYISQENGFCLLYPNGFSAQPDTQRPEEVLVLSGPRESPQPKKQELIAVSLSIAYNGQADGLDSAEYASKWHELYAAGEGAPYESQQVTIGEQMGIVLSNLTGFVSKRSAFLVANGIKYRISLTPQPEDVPELTDPANQIWETVTGSIVFFPPQNQRAVVRAEKVCPKGSAGTRQYVREVDGYCFLYPASFKPNSEFHGTVVGGPVLGKVEGFGNVRASLTVGTFGYFPNQTPRQVLEPRMEFVDADSVQETTIGGYPAVTFRDSRDPWTHQQAIIVVNGNVYTIVAQPWEPERYPEGISYLENVWETVTGSLTFFDPWR